MRARRAASTGSRRTCSPSSSGRSRRSKAAGIDVISLGIGDPDTADAAAHRRGDDEARRTIPARTSIPSNRGRAEFREAVARFYRRALRRRRSIPRRQVMPAIGGKECIYNLNFAFLDAGDVALASDPGYPVYTGGPLLAGAEPVLMPLRSRARVRARPRRDSAPTRSSGRG